MKVNYTCLGSTMVFFASMLMPSILQAAEGRVIEEVVVTAERKESSVQDTSISITAFTSEMMDEFGIRNQSDLQNMVPATTIQPYDSAIRGVGRNFRNLGGDPGIATYMNGIYSEDLYTATIGSFWDIDRIEILRGPQGTLYGRNAVGGAMNFLYKKPTDEFEFEVKTVIGDYDTQDYYGVISGPLIEDVLSGRLTMSSREHDGWVDELSGLGPDLDSGDETNVAISLEWILSDTMTFNIRQNVAEVDRVIGGADGGGLVVLNGENSHPGGNGLRDYTRQNHGLRVVDAAQLDPTQSDFVDQTQAVLVYTNPTTGAPITAQYVRPGVDSGSGTPNHGFGVTLDPAACVFNDRDDIDGDDLCAYTNGFNNETFDQKGTQVEFAWDISDTITFKYLFGYNDLLYRRTTDDDSTASDTDRQFYVNHEAEYISHEFQLFWDVGDNLTFTSGIFFYNATIDQRADFYTQSEQHLDPAFSLDSILATVAPGFIPGDPPLTFLAGSGASPIDLTTAQTVQEANGDPVGTFTSVFGAYLGGDTLGSLRHGPDTTGSDITSTQQTKREAFAAYTQGVWDINDRFTLTAGIRYAEDEIQGEEVLARYAMTTLILDGAMLTLLQANVIRGAINPATLQPTGLIGLWSEGVPVTFAGYRKLDETYDKITWRINLDYALTDDSLIYGNVTTGYRSGGFNLALFSQTPSYDPEELIAYELGYKAQFFDNSFQFNASVYVYDYETIHTSTEEACPVPETAQSLQSSCAVVKSTSSIQAAPGAEINGLEFEVLWLATDSLTLGGNFSYTDSEYTESFIVVDGADPTTPSAIYTEANNADRARDIKGNGLLQVPETKWNLYGTYNFPLGGGGELDLLTSISYIDDVYFSAFETDYDKAPAYDRVDIRATWTSPSESWVVSGFVNNVFDEIGIRQILRHGSADGYRRTAQVTEPRLYGVEIAYTFL